MRAYLISKSWWEEFCRLAGAMDATPPRLSPINNTKVVLSGPQSCELISGRVWQQLTAWYGGGPAVFREVVQDPATGGLFPVLDKYNVQVHFGGRTVCCEVANLTRVSELKVFAAGHFGVHATGMQLIDTTGLFALADSDLLSAYVRLPSVPLELTSGDVARLAPRTSLSWEPVVGAVDDNSVPRIAASGSLCYMASLLQCLLRSSEFVRAISSWDFRKQAAIGRAFRTLVQTAARGSVDLQCLNFAVGSKARHFARGGQHDAHDFFTVLLSQIQAEISPKYRALSISESGDGVADPMLFFTGILQEVGPAQQFVGLLMLSVK
jgi:hypothetical protein